MEHDFSSSGLNTLLVILAAAGIVIPAFARFRITPIIGFILVGILVGPFGLGSLAGQYPWLSWVTITDSKSIDPVGEYGIILLLFSIGLELSFRRLWSMRRRVFGLGALGLFGGALLIAPVLLITGQSLVAAIGLGLALSLSSTALVLPISGTKSAVGRSAFSMLLFEDLAIVPIIFLLGALAPQAGGASWDIFFQTLFQGALVIAAILVIGRFLLPPLFDQAARTKTPELFLSASLLVIILSSLATSAVGLSPIVGALVAGILIAETDYQSQVEVMISPFRGLALGIFLISIGMQIDLAYVARNWPSLVVAITGVLIANALVTGILLRFAGARAGTATETGLLMASPSETTLIVLTAASAAAVIDSETAKFWQVATAMGLTITPILARIGHDIARRMEMHVSGQTLTEDIDPDTDRTVIIGFGRVGQLVADMLRKHDQPYVAVESNIDAVVAARRAGYHVIFGDVAAAGALEKLHVADARALILTMDAPVLIAHTVKRVRKALPDLKIVARARDVDHAAELYRAGASDAVPETLESSLQLSEAVLVDLGVPMGPVIASIHEKRDEFRRQIMDQGGLNIAPRLKSGTS
jgi:monovalent cation:H+ antiporter-2, CPA2 family